LEQLHFEAYDNRFGKTHPSLNDWGPELDAEIKKLRRELIVDEILAAECESNSLHTFFIEKFF
jgi:hypothetical protein